MRYRKAPITEALIDIRIQPTGIEYEALRKIKSLIPDYPREELRQLTQVTSFFGPEVKATTQQQPLGYAYFSTDGKQVFQARIDGFTFSRLEPYESWDAFSAEAKRLWPMYKDVAKPSKISRIAVRFINRLVLPGVRIEPEEYLNTFAHISNSLPDELRTIGPFLMSVRLLQNDLRGWMVLNESLAPIQSPGTVSVILDLDLFVEDPKISGDDELWHMFERLRERKNTYFEACITDKTRELLV